MDADAGKARAYLDQAIAAGNSYSGIVLGQALLRGEGLPQDVPAGSAVLEAQIPDGNVAAVAGELGRFYVTGGGGIAADAGKAVAYLEQAVAAGNRQARISIARIYLDGLAGANPDAQKGLKVLLDGAETGDPDSMVELIRIYLRGGGNGMVQPSDLKANEMLKRYAAVGDPNGVRFQTMLVEGARGQPGFRAIGELFIDLNQGDRPRAIREVFYTNKNAAVYLAQLMLKSAGFYDGGANGLLTAPTIKAFLSACRTGKIGKCAEVPLHADTLSFIAENYS
ncbi:tetratricopeptide repeat protein [Bauldia litoralis]|uniref:tetratricopeptide repeat protein n=1 Tax=Bauldia litoralis TaxID=665467 RepID=UPI001113C6F2|nr:sel1 repeat family protein [Bauldia litoralis]